MYFWFHFFIFLLRLFFIFLSFSFQFRFLFIFTLTLFITIIVTFLRLNLYLKDFCCILWLNLNNFWLIYLNFILIIYATFGSGFLNQLIHCSNTINKYDYHIHYDIKNCNPHDRPTQNVSYFNVTNKISK